METVISGIIGALDKLIGSINMAINAIIKVIDVILDLIHSILKKIARLLWSLLKLIFYLLPFVLFIIIGNSIHSEILKWTGIFILSLVGIVFFRDFLATVMRREVNSNTKSELNVKEGRLSRVTATMIVIHLFTDGYAILYYLYGIDFIKQFTSGRF